CDIIASNRVRHYRDTSPIPLVQEHEVKPTRRTVVKSAGFALLTPALGVLGQASSSGPARAQEPAWRHGVSLFGKLRYQPGFKNFDYVNPAAPKGGVV